MNAAHSVLDNFVCRILKCVCRIKFQEWGDVFFAYFSIDRSLLFDPTLVHACELMQPMHMQGHFK
jgi:hypothetical protein